MAKHNKVGHFERFIPALKNSLQGLQAAYRYEIAFRQEVFLSLFLIPTAYVVGDSFTEFAILLSPVFIILITELLNSGIEAAIDRIGPEFHELSGRAKDIGSAAVLIALIYFVLVWGYKISQILTN